MKKLLMITTLLLSFAVFAHEGQDRGNGGDDIRFVFEEGRKAASEKVLNLKRCSFASDVSPQIADWILFNRSSLSQDILKSPHVWITSKQTTCAFTQITDSHAITLSFEECKKAATVDQAARLLVHESVHHFGISDETFADRVAMGIATANDQAVCQTPSADPFEESSCVGDAMTEEQKLSYYSPGKTVSNPVAQLKFASRKRFCTAKTGCTEWYGSEHTPFGFVKPKSDRNCSSCEANTNFVNFAKEAKDYFSDKHEFAFDVNGAINISFKREAKSDVYEKFEFKVKESAGQFELNPNSGSSKLVLGAESQKRYSEAVKELEPYIIPLKGRLTDHCLRLSNQVTAPTKNPNQWIEIQGVIYSNF